MIPFGEWLPDQAPLNSSGATVATNVIAAARGYRPFLGLATLSQAGDAYLRGFFATIDSSGTVHLFAGNATKLYKFNASTAALDDVKSGAYTLASKDQWKFVQFGTSVYAASGLSNALQKYTIGSSSTFANVSGSPNAKFLAVIRDFVVTAHVNYSSTTHPSRVRWSQINDADTWTIGSNQADIQDIPDAGNITGLVGGDFGVVLLERGIARMQYVGSPLIFTFDMVETGHGCDIPNSIAALAPTQIFYLASDGFFMFNGERSIPIGAEKVDTFFFDDSSPHDLDRLSCSIDPINQVVAWSYVSTESTGGTPDKIIMYNYAVGRWSLAELDHEFIGTIISPSFTLEALATISSSLDALGTSLDSRFFRGGQSAFAASSSSKIASFTGDALAATLETGEFEPSKLKKSLVKSVTPYVTSKDVAPTLTVQVGSRSRQIDTVSFTASANLNTDNFVPVRSNGRYHRVRVNASGGTWRYALGVDVETASLGRR